MQLIGRSSTQNRVKAVLRAVAYGLLTLWVTSVVIFFASNLAGVDAASAAEGRYLTPHELAIFRHQQGLDKPLLERYVDWIAHVAVGDWGFALSTHVSTASLVVPRLVHSVLVASIALGVAVPLAFLIGALAARKPGGPLDTLLSTSTLFLIGLPTFVIGLVLLYLFAVWLKLLPPDSSGVLYGSSRQKAEAYVLPTLTLALLLIPYIARMVRTTSQEVMNAPYVQAALLRGVSGTRLYLRHVLPNAIGPVINVIALSLSEVLAGIIVIENVFGFPGLGQLTVYSVSTNDTDVVQICVLCAATGYVIINLIADGAVVLLNPRLRRGQPH